MSLGGHIPQKTGPTSASRMFFAGSPLWSMQADDFYNLALLRLFPDHPREVGELMTRFGGSSRRLFTDLRPLDLAAAGLPSINMNVDGSLGRQVAADLQWVREAGHHMISLFDETYPLRLKEIFDPPFLLFGDGNLELLTRKTPAVAMVGSRNASQYGLDQAYRLAGELADQGIVVVSGLALGIDGAAHRGAVSVNGETIAVLGTGCDQVYPRRHQRLASDIREKGLILSEFPLGTPAYPSNFPRRNRVVTGICMATIVVEAAVNSGSLISAGLALSEGRDLMALPGQVTNRRARGCHRLIRDGALLVESASDVLRELGMEVTGSGPTVEVTSEEAGIISALEHQPLGVDQLAEKLQCPLSALLTSLTALEIRGLVKMESGLYQSTGHFAE